VTKVNDNSATGTLKYGPNTLNASYTFTNSLPTFQAHHSIIEGTKLWKVSDGYDDTCGPKPSVPPLLESDSIMEQCKKVAGDGGFGVYGFMDGECYVAKNVNTLTDGTDCVDFGSSHKIGTNSNFAAYELEGVKNSGLYRYGYVTADETLREYPNTLQRKTDKFDSIGRKQILRSPRVKTFTGMGGGVDACKAKCMSTFGDDCEAFNYEKSTGNCSIYGADALEQGAIVPVGNSELLIRGKELNNHESCPSNFSTVNSSVWTALPKDGMMNINKMCSLGEILSSGRSNQARATSTLNGSVNSMNTHVQADVASNKALQPDYFGGYSTLQHNLSEYNNLYNQ
jgi:hypothetical protein